MTEHAIVMSEQEIAAVRDALADALYGTESTRYSIHLEAVYQRVDYVHRSIHGPSDADNVYLKGQ